MMHMLSSGYRVQECDATKYHSSNAAGFINSTCKSLYGQKSFDKSKVKKLTYYLSYFYTTKT